MQERQEKPMRQNNLKITPALAAGVISYLLIQVCA
jgi:hypothetical protein